MSDLSVTRNRTIRPDTSDEDRRYIEIVLDTLERYERRRWIFEREWYRNILMYLGQQWITYEETYRRWRTRNMPKWVPLPVTNRLGSTVNVIRANVAQVHPAFTAYPTQENEKSVLSANAADKYLEVIMHESGLRAAKRRMASWVTMTGNAFLFNEFDTSPETGTVTIPGEKCLDCGNSMGPEEIPQDLKCTICGGANLQEDPANSAEIPQGQIRTRCLSPFEVYVEPLIMELEDQSAVLVIERRGFDDVKLAYPQTADTLEPDAERHTATYFLESLAYMTGTGFGSGISVGNLPSDHRQTVTLYRLFLKRSKDFPEGFYCVMSGDQHILEVKKPYPYRFTTTKKAFYPLIHIRYDDVPGRFWAKTPVDDLVPKQRQRNELESLFQTIVMRMSNPVWLIPQGTQTSPITGDPGIMVKYTSVGGNKPERLAGIDAPASVIQFIAQIDQDFEELANTFAVMKGKNPGSVRAASAIQLLVERGFGRYGSVFDNLEEAYEKWAVQTLELWRQRAVFPRVQAIAKTAGSWQFMEFLGSDLGELDIRVEAGSTRPKSQAARQMLVGQALQWGLLNPNDPEQKMKIFEELGMVHLLPGAEADVKVVAEENTKFISWANAVRATIDNEENADLPPDQVFLQMMQTFPMRGNAVLDHHPTHIVHHRRFALTEEFRSLPDSLKNMFVQHIVLEHLQPMLAELATGVGITGLAAMMPQGTPASGSNTPGTGGRKPSGGGPEQAAGGGSMMGAMNPNGRSPA